MKMSNTVKNDLTNSKKRLYTFIKNTHEFTFRNKSTLVRLSAIKNIRKGV